MEWLETNLEYTLTFMGSLAVEDTLCEWGG
jgi:hypothetical protein